MVADKIFDLTVSSQLVYQSDISIKGKTFVKVFIDRAGEGTWEVIDGNDYQLINDSLVFTERPTGSLLIMQVATTPSELQQTPTDISLLLTIKEEIKTLVANLGDLVVISESVDKVIVVANNISSVNIVATNIANVVTTGANIAKVVVVADNITHVSNVDNNMSEIVNVSVNSVAVVTISDNMASIITIKDNISDVQLLANNMVNINTIVSNIVPNLTEILNADTNAQIATDKAEEALSSELKAKKWAEETVNVPVETGLYSAKHWAIKAQEVVTEGVIDDTAPSLIKTFSSNKITENLPYIGLDTTNIISPILLGQRGWNQEDGTSEINLGNGVLLQDGQEILVPIRNGTESTISNMTPCMVIGTVGNSGKILVSPMDGTVQSNADKFLGFATQDIISGADGFVTLVGKVRGVDTSLLTEQQPIFISTTTIGALTTIPPTVGMRLKVGYVIKSHINGTLFVRTTILDENAYIPKVPSTNKALCIFNGTNGDVQNSNVILEGTTLLFPSNFKIMGDFTNATYSSRTSFQTSYANSPTAMECLPSGTATSSFWLASNSSDLDNNGYISIASLLTHTELRSASRGSGGLLPLRIFVGSTKQAEFPLAGGLHVTNGLLGFGDGSGGTVTQTTSKGTAITLDKASGRITMNNVSLGAGASVVFTLNNSLLTNTSTVTPNITGGVTDASNYRLETINVTTGSARFRLTNLSGGALAEAVIFQFNALKGAIA